MKAFFTLLHGGLLALLFPLVALAQSVGIGTTTPDASAALEIRATAQGLLLPRLTLAQRNAMGTGGIAAPVAALIIYQTDNTPGLYAYSGSAWVLLGADNLGNHTATQNLNIQSNALIGTGDNIGTTLGVGVRADGGLNIGQNTAGYSLYLGFRAGLVNTGNYNQFIGYASGTSNTTGSNNLFSGINSGYSNTTGNNNLFSGSSSGSNNTTGSNNLFIGFATGNANITGNDNVYSGHYSGYSNTTGSSNLFSGSLSGLYNTTGSNNLFLGFTSGYYNTTGSNNTALGYGSGPVTGNLTNSTALGNAATVTTSNTIQLGNGNVANLMCSVGLTTTSDSRFKYDVQANVPGLAFITLLRPVTYRFDNSRLSQFERTGTMVPRSAPDAASIRHTGFLAQDVEQLARALHYDFDGVHVPANTHDHYGLNYAQFVVPLVRAVQEQQKQIESLQVQNGMLQNKLEADHASLLSMQQQLIRLQELVSPRAVSDSVYSLTPKRF